jgi:hypothetical protein
MSTFNYPFDKLYGPGTTCSIDLVAGTTYTFDITNNTGSSYFVLETVRDYNGVTPKNLSGSLTNFSNIAYHVADDYKAGFVLPTSTNSFDFTPANNVVKETLMFRGTGGIILSLSTGSSTPDVGKNYQVSYTDATGSVVNWSNATSGEAKCDWLYATSQSFSKGGNVLYSVGNPTIGSQLYTNIAGTASLDSGKRVIDGNSVYTLTIGVVTNIETFASLPACV